MRKSFYCQKILFFVLLDVLFTSCLKEEQLGNTEIVIVGSECVERPNGERSLFVKSPGQITWMLIDEKSISIRYTPGFEYTLVVKPIMNSHSYRVLNTIKKEKKRSSNIPRLSFGDLVDCSPDELAFDNLLSDGEVVAPGVVKLDSLFIIDGDIVMTETDYMESIAVKSGYKNTYYWSDCNVYYTYAPGFTEGLKVQQAIPYFENHTGLHFIYGTSPKGYIEFFMGGGTYSTATGKTGGKQQISLTSATQYGSVIHEIGHALGLIHEHRRPDRDNYVEVYTQNIIDDELEQFAKFSSADAVCHGPFDLNSVMMYSSLAFSKNGQYTMKTVDGAVFGKQRDSLSLGDVACLASIYGPPYQKLDVTRTIVRDEVWGIYEYYEYYDTYTVSYYQNPNYTNSAYLTYPRPVSLVKDIYYYDDHFDQYMSDTIEYNVVVPAGCHSYNIAVLYSSQNYIMSNPTDYYVQSLSLF